MTQKPTDPLLEGVSQYDVDFVIPRIGIDLPLGIDPFLMFKSRDEELRRLHQIITDHFNAGIRAVSSGRLDIADEIFDFPEVAAIGLGYTKSGKRGSGLGGYLRDLIIETLKASPGLQERGVLHVEEMQLLASGIGPDRISDISANILKGYLIEYTQRQAEIWGVPLRRGIPLPHIYDERTQSWVDSYVDLPVSPVDDAPVLFVPRRIVRALPWINYDDFLQRDFRAYMEARRKTVTNSGHGAKPVLRSAKLDVANVTRQDVTIIDRYVKNREQHASDAQPSMEYIDEQAKKRAAVLIDRLSTTPAGREECDGLPVSRPGDSQFSLRSGDSSTGDRKSEPSTGRNEETSYSQTTQTRHSGHMHVQITTALCLCSKLRIRMISVWRRSLRQPHTLAVVWGGWVSLLLGSRRRSS